MELRSRKPRRTILETNLLLRLAKSKRKRTFAHNRTQKFSEIGIRNYWRRNGFTKKVFKKNNSIRPANRKTRVLFYQEKRNRTKEDWKKLFSSDETMVVIKNACKIQIWGKSDKKHVPHLICCEDKKQVAVMFWGCVSSRGEEALIPVFGTIDSVNRQLMTVEIFHPKAPAIFYFITCLLSCVNLCNIDSVKYIDIF